ncbi:thioredoxin domain-containing protein [Cystoisospora suis]|uniref:Thioredoxin domain-containing protein n=1 Tax=Cystoisospora suis TaxID=483139 RepID=A0A2C6KUL9_9APIC|nr:thioredoxin domain-containing protein [Cystoisospora suis]
MATAEKLGKIATDIVLDKVTQDKIHLASRNEEKIRRQKESEDGDQAFTTQDGEEESDLSSQTETLDDLSHWREKRMQQIKAAREKEEVYRQQGHGSYEEIIEEEFLPTVTKSENAVCHFFNSTFERCKVMDKHLHQLALLHMETKFVK